MTSKAFGLAQLGNAYSDGALGSRNRIINGAMTIDQRNAGAAVTYGAQAYITDRFSVEKANLSTLVATAQQVSDAPDGFRQSLKTTVTTAEASGASSSFIAADFRIEGYDFADFSFGTAGAKTFTLSFWVKASVTGTYCVSFFNANVSRAYLATYVVSSANTWEYKTITVAGDTSGTWNITNGIGLGAQFTVGGGSNQEGTAGAWGGTYKNRVSGAVDLNATLNATWQITGVQLEAGDTATPFEHRSYGAELALCQRYYYFETDKLVGTYGYDPFKLNINVTFPVTMRANATFVTTSTSSHMSLVTASNRFVAFRNSSSIPAVGDIYLSFTASAEL
jgi:hypothetical protein